MKGIVNAVEYIEKNYNMVVFRNTSSSRTEEIMMAEDELGLKFANEFKEFAKNFTGLEFAPEEFGELQEVISDTECFREIVDHDEFPSNLYVIRYLEYNSSFILQDENGVIYYTDGFELLVKIFNSFEEYLYLDVVPELMSIKFDKMYDEFYDGDYSEIQKRYMADRRWFEETYGLDFYFFVACEGFDQFLSDKKGEDVEIRSLIEEYVEMIGLEELENIIPKADSSKFEKIEKVEEFSYYADYI